MGSKKSFLMAIPLSLAVLLAGFPLAEPASMDTEQFGNSMDFVKENALGATVHDGLFVRASDTTGIYNYLAENGLVKQVKGWKK